MLGRWPLIGILFSALTFRSGTAVTSFALPWLVNSLAASSLLASLAIASCLIASVMGALLGGTLIDSMGPPFAVRMAGLCGAVAIALVPALHQFDILAPTMLVALLACTTFFDAAASSAQDSRLPEIAGFAEVPLRRVIATKSVIGYSATLGAPLVAGLAARELGTVPTLWHSAAALLVGGVISGWAMARCQKSLTPETTPTEQSALAGSTTLWRDALLRSSILVTAGAVAVVSATSSIIIPRLLKMGAGDVQEYGGFVAAVSGGSMLGSIVYGMVGHRLAFRTVGIGGFLLIALSMLLLGFLFSTPVLVIAGILLGTATSPMAAAMSVILFQRITIQRRGRTFGIVTAMMTCVTPLAMVVVGYGVDRFGPQSVLTGLAMASGIAILIPRKYLHQKTRHDG